MSIDINTESTDILPDQTDEDIPYDYKIDYVTTSANGANIRRKIDIESGRGDTDKTLTNTFMGFNHRIAPSHVPKNRETDGLTLFTRPDFNLNEANISQSRRMKQMGESDIRSGERAILGMLDPLCPYCQASPVSEPRLGVPFHDEVVFDNKQAFIPILTNRLTSLTGFPDNTLDVYTSSEGFKREQWSMVDSHYAANYAYTLNATFKNLDGDIITRIFTTWLEAMSALYDGTFIPRARNLTQNEICYNTRIYRILLDPTNKYVTKIGTALAAFPVNDNLGAAMNVDGESFVTDANDQINIQFQCDGAAYLDPILIEEFNEVVSIFNPDMIPEDWDADEFIPSGKDYLRKLTPSELITFNYYGYPHIDRTTRELSWYIDSDVYESILAELQ